jgi:hypothetical protein
MFCVIKNSREAGDVAFARKHGSCRKAHWTEGKHQLKGKQILNWYKKGQKEMTYCFRANREELCIGYDCYTKETVF